MKRATNRLKSRLSFTLLSISAVLLLLAVFHLWAKTRQNPELPMETEPADFGISFPYDTQTELGAYNELIEAFYDLSDEIAIDVSFYPREDAWQTVYQKYSGVSVSELILLDHGMIPAFQKLEMLQPMNEFWMKHPETDNIYTKLKESVTIEGDYYALPFSAYTFAILSNTELLGKYGMSPPRSWDELLQTAIEIQREPADAFAIAAAPGESLSQVFLQMLISNGASIRNLRSPDALEIIGLFQTLVDQRLIARDCVNWNRQDLTDKFATRQVAMIITDSSQIPRLAEHDMAFSWMISPLPGRGSSNRLILGESLALTTAEMTEQIEQFLAYLMLPETVSLRSEKFGSIPVRFDVEHELFSPYNMNSVFYESFSQGEGLPRFVLWQNISETLQTAVIDAFSPDQSAEEIAQAMHAQVIEYIIDGG